MARTFVPRLFSVSIDAVPHAESDHLLRHSVHFYDRPSSLIDRVCEYVRDGLRAGDAAIIICTSEHLNSIDACLAARGSDVSALKESGQYVPLDAAQTLDLFMVHGRPDRQRFSDVGGRTGAPNARRVSPCAGVRRDGRAALGTGK